MSSTKEMVRDAALRHGSVNTILPPTVFALLGEYAPKAVEAIIKWVTTTFGAEAPKYLPAVNIIAISALITGIEVAIRKSGCCCGASDEGVIALADRGADVEVAVDSSVSGIAVDAETGVGPSTGADDAAEGKRTVRLPISILGDLTERQALTLIVVGLAAQTVQASLAPELALARLLTQLYANPLFASLGQIAAAKVVDKTFEVGYWGVTKAYELGSWGIGKLLIQEETKLYNNKTRSRLRVFYGIDN